MPVAILLALLFGGSTASAAIDASKLPAAKSAARSFAAAAKGSESSGEAPRESNPKIRALLEAVFDTRDLQSGKAVPFQSLGELSERIMLGVQVGSVYMLAGTGKTDVGQVVGDQAIVQKTNLNTIKFEPEMGRFFDFQLRMQSAIVESILVQTRAASPAQAMRLKSALAGIRAGTARTVSGLIETIAVNGLTEAWRRERLVPLLEIAPKLAKFLNKEQKSVLEELARACADVMDDQQVKSNLLRFARLLAG